MVDSGIASGRDGVLEASVIRSEIRSRAELNCALRLFLHPSYQRDTAHGPIGTGRLRARRRFGYWGEQIGHLRAQSGHHFGAAPAELEPVVVPSRAVRNKNNVLALYDLMINTGRLSDICRGINACQV